MTFRSAHALARYLLNFLLAFLVGSLVLSVSRRLQLPMPRLGVLARWEIQNSILVFIFYVLLMFKVFILAGPVQEMPSFTFESRRSGKFNNPWWTLLFLAVPLLFLHFRSLNSFPVYDDLDNFRRAAKISENSEAFFPYLIPRRQPSWYRPLVLAFNQLDYFLWGTNFVGWRLMNMGLHLMNSWMVYFLAGRMRNDYRLGFLAGLLFAIHPLHPEPVTWISGRTDVLAACFYLGAFVFFLRFRQVRLKGWAAASLLCFALALMSKEAAITLPLVLLAYILIFGRFEGHKVETRGLGLIGLHVLIMVAYLAFRLVMIGDIGGRRNATGVPDVFRPDAAIALFSFFATPTLHFFFPFNRAIPSVQFLLPILALVLSLPLVLLMVRSHLLREHSVVFCLVFLPISVLPMYHLLYISPELFNSRYLYIPSIPLAILVATLLVEGFDHLTRWKRIVLFVSAMLLVVAFCLLTLLQNTHWRMLGGVASRLPSELHSMHPHLKPGTRFYIYGAPVKWRNSYVVYGPNLHEAISLFYGHRDFTVYDAAWDGSSSRNSFRNLPDPRSLNPGKTDLIFWYDQTSGQLHDVSAELREVQNRPSTRKEVVWDFKKTGDGESSQLRKSGLEERAVKMPSTGKGAEIIISVPADWIPSVSDVIEIRLRVDWPDRDVSRKAPYIDISWKSQNASFISGLAVQLPVIADGQWRAYSAPIGWYVPWLLSSLGVQLRLRPMPFPARAEIESIRLSAVGVDDRLSSRDMERARCAATSNRLPLSRIIGVPPCLARRTRLWPPPYYGLSSLVSPARNLGYRGDAGFARKG